MIKYEFGWKNCEMSCKKCIALVGKLIRAYQNRVGKTRIRLRKIRIWMGKNTNLVGTTRFRKNPNLEEKKPKFGRKKYEFG